MLMLVKFVKCQKQIKPAKNLVAHEMALSNVSPPVTLFYLQFILENLTVINGHFLITQKKKILCIQYGSFKIFDSNVTDWM